MGFIWKAKKKSTHPKWWFPFYYSVLHIPYSFQTDPRIRCSTRLCLHSAPANFPPPCYISTYLVRSCNSSGNMVPSNRWQQRFTADISGHLSCCVFAIRYPNSASSTGSRSQHVASRLKIGDQTLKTWRLIKYHETSEILVSRFQIKWMLNWCRKEQARCSLNILNGCVAGPFVLLASGNKSGFKLQKDSLIYAIIIIKRLQQSRGSSTINVQFTTTFHARTSGHLSRCGLAILTAQAAPGIRSLPPWRLKMGGRTLKRTTEISEYFSICQMGAKLMPKKGFLDGKPMWVWPVSALGS